MKNWHAPVLDKCWTFRGSYFGLMTPVLLCSLMMIVVYVHGLFLNKQILMHLFLISYCSGTDPRVEEKYKKLQSVPIIASNWWN